MIIKILFCSTHFRSMLRLQVLTMVLNYPFPDLPDVTLTYDGDTVTCYADANPQVPEPSGYMIIINDTDDYEPDCADGACTLGLTVDYETDVGCDATNTVGTGTKTIVALPPGKRGFLYVQKMQFCVYVRQKY